MRTATVEQRVSRTGEMTIERGSRGRWRLEASVVLPESRDRLFEFFSDAFQLETLTPPWLKFHVVTPAPIQITEGVLIDYRLRLHGIPMRWQSRISVWDPPHRFVDEQVHGPYRYWHHEHLFTEIREGTLCRDVVDYSVPGGALVHSLFVRPDLVKIFQFRLQKLQELFGRPSLPREPTGDCVTWEAG